MRDGVTETHTIVADTHVVVSEVQHDVADTHTMVSEIHRETLRSPEGTDDQLQSANDTRTISITECMLTTAQAKTRSATPTTAGSGPISHFCI